MNVHIVCHKPEANGRVLGRLALSLAASTGWTIGDEPDDNADLNYYFPYLEYTAINQPYTKTPTAAWFTHKDTYQKGKVLLWDRAANEVGLRTVSARIYESELSQYGETRIVTPPIDLDKFTIDPHYISADMPVVGTSGFVYPGGRKGEDMIAALSQNKSFHLRVIGNGWPVKSRVVRWDKLERFYQGIDIYVCTSLVEGVGYGPLEALACGKQVVIPRHVGVFDDLPDIPGIWHYEAGNFGALAEGIEKAIGSKPEPEMLRTIVSKYSAKAWADTHRQALLEPVPKYTAKNTLGAIKKRCGVYYVAFGKPSRKMAKKAIVSFKKYMPDIEIALVSDKALKAGEDVFIKHPDSDIGGRKAKISIDELAPTHWKYILYLDADTEIVNDISFLYRAIIDGWDFIVCKNPGKYHVLEQMIRPDNGPETEYTFHELGSKELLQLNGGVFCYHRNQRTKRFFELWFEEWDRWGGRDQAALHRALYQQPLKTYVMSTQWNTITRYDDPSITAGILHYPTTARRWTGRIDGRLDSQAAWDKVRG